MSRSTIGGSHRVTIGGSRRVHNRLRDRTPADDGALDAGALRVGRGRQDEYPASVGGGDLQQWIQRAESQVGRCGDRVGRQWALAHPGLGVGRHGGSDIAALGVGEHQHTVGLQRGDGAFEHGETSRPISLEKRHLRFDDTEPGVGLNADLTEPGQSVRGDRQPPGLHQVRVRVDTHAERAAGGDRLRQPCSEPRRISHGGPGHVSLDRTTRAVPAASAHRCRHGWRPRCPAPPPRLPGPW